MGTVNDSLAGQGGTKLFQDWTAQYREGGNPSLNENGTVVSNLTKQELVLAIRTGVVQAGLILWLVGLVVGFLLAVLLNA